jgi:hypothetical protein
LTAVTDTNQGVCPCRAKLGRKLDYLDADTQLLAGGNCGI